MVAVRFPKGKEVELKNYETKDDFSIYSDSDVALISYGVLFKEIVNAQSILNEQNFVVASIKMNKIYPISLNLIEKLKKYKEIFFF